jgi:hypothetical protein
MASKIKTMNYNEVEHSKLVYQEPNDKTIPNSKVGYQEMQVKYNVGTNEVPNLQSYTYFTCKVVCRNGIFQPPAVNDNDGGSKKEAAWMLNLVLDINNPETVKLREVFEQDYTYSVAWINNYAYDTNTGKPTNKFICKWNKDYPEGTFENKIYHPKNKTTKVLIEGASPTLSIKLEKYEKNQTTFVDKNNKIISWEFLKGKTFEAILKVTLRKLYIGKNLISIQRFVTSGVVIRIIPRENADDFNDIIASMGSQMEDITEQMKNENGSSVPVITEISQADMLKMLDNAPNL